MTEDHKLFVWVVRLPGNVMTFCVAHGLSKEEAIRRIVNRAATTITSDPDRLDAFERGIRLQPEPVELVEGVALLGVQLDPELPE